MGNATSRWQPQSGHTSQSQPQSGSGTNATPYPPAVPQQPQVYTSGSGAPNSFHPGYRPQQLEQPSSQLPSFTRSSAGPGPIPVTSPISKQLTKTATIRNNVNLKKSTLHLTPVPGDPDRLQISFTFDSSAPCRVTTFVTATEEPSQRSRITSATTPWAPPVCYEKGLGLRFPATGSADEAKHTVDVRKHSDGTQPTDKNPNSFALIIRLETITERGLKEGHTLKELVQGGPQESWVQSQTTFATLARNEEHGEWEARVLKQRIWVEDISYLLQEIYGMENAAGGGGIVTGEVTDAEAEDRLCVICLVNERNTTVLPCRHMCMCNECAQELRKQTQRCPICRNPVESLLHIRLGTKAKEPGIVSSKSRSSVQLMARLSAPPIARPAVENV